MAGRLRRSSCCPRAMCATHYTIPHTRAVRTCTANMLNSCQHGVHSLHAVEPLMQQQQQACAFQRFCLSVYIMWIGVVGQVSTGNLGKPPRGVIKLLMSSPRS